MRTCRVLVASADTHTRTEVRSALQLQGHQVAEASTAAQTIQEACDSKHEVLVMGSVVNGMAAPQLCSAIRSRSKLGIIVYGGNVWGGSLATSSIDLLDAGADDFVPAPFALAELLARVRAISRRVGGFEGRHRIVLQDRHVDLRSYEIKGPGTQVSHLTPKEFLVLQYLVSHANEPKTTRALARTIWQRDGKGDLEYVRVVIRQLRRKIEPDPSNPRYIRSERTSGYRFSLPHVATN